MNISNLLTLFRLFLIPIFLLFFFSNIRNSFIYSICVFLLAGLTDILDGYIARKRHIITDWGTVFDPLADKLMLITVLSCLFIGGYIPIWISIVVILKELTMVICGSVMFTKGVIIPSNVFGKLASLLFYIAVTIMIFDKTISTYLMYFAVGGAITAFINYIVVYIRGKQKNY